MKRFHVHVHVADLDSSLQFYSTLFGEQPSVIKADYAKWMLEDPRVNFAISSGAANPTIDHLGLQVESDDDLGVIAGRLSAAGAQVKKQENATCCYAKGNKGWVTDPSGVSWETFHTFGESTVYGSDIVAKPAPAVMRETETACCAPAPTSSTSCCAAKTEA